MDYRERLPFPLFPQLFPGLFAVWYFDSLYPDDDPEEEAFDVPVGRAGAWRGTRSDEAGGTARGHEAGGGTKATPSPDQDVQTPVRRRPLSPHTQRTLSALLRLLDTRPVQEFPNLLTDPWHLHSILDGLPAPPRLTYDDLDDLTKLRDQLGEALLAGSPLEAHELLNELALAGGVTPQITGDGELMHRTAFQDATATIAALFVPVVMELHAFGWSDRVRECAEPRCWSYFLDQSKRGNRRCCSPACAARARARRHRESRVLGGR